MIPNVYSASTLPFVNTKGEPGISGRDRARLQPSQSITANKLVTYYYSFSSLMLPPSEINRLLAAKRDFV